MTSPRKYSLAAGLFYLLTFVSMAIATLPIAVWELSLGVYLTFWGFRAAPIIAGL